MPVRAVVFDIGDALERNPATGWQRRWAGRLRMELEDVVQEGFLRLYRSRESGERIESPRAYLSAVVSRLSLDHLRSARVRRETYMGEWLPEPLMASADDDPARKETSCSAATAAARCPHSNGRSNGRTRVARALIAGLRGAARFAGFSLRREEVNGQRGALFPDREDSWPG